MHGMIYFLYIVAPTSHESLHHYMRCSHMNFCRCKWVRKSLHIVYQKDTKFILLYG